MLLAEQFVLSLAGIHGHQHPVSTDRCTGYPSQACRFLRLHHHPIHSSYGKSIIIERIMQYTKDRTECFDDYFP
jgi:putative transposase